MSVKILSDIGTAVSATNAAGLLTFADNKCLPAIIAETFGWKAIRIEFTNDTGKTTTFGACRIGKKIVLLPHFSYGAYSDPETAKSIFNELSRQGYACEWRRFEKISDFVFTDKVTTLLPLLTGSEEQFNKLAPDVKRKIRKSERNGIIVKSGKAELLRDFYAIYSRNMHRLGSPALPIRWFRNLLNNYHDGETGIWIASFNEKPIGGAFLLEYNGFYEACWISTLHEFNRLYTSYGLYWHLIRYAVEHNGKHFSFGRSSTGSGVHSFKQQWGGVDFPLYWNYSQQPANNIRSVTFLPKLWKLLPYPIARLLGPLVSGRFY